MFFQFKEHAQCEKSFFWHITFLNNIIPWSRRDSCMQWTWYLACDMQFYLLVPVLASIYYHNRGNFWISISLLWFTCGVISAFVILRNEFSASYFTYKDSYWTVFYEKPWARFPAYLVGIITGCSYYTYKHEQRFSQGVIRQTVVLFDESDSNIEPLAKQESERDPEKNLVIVLFDKVQKNKWFALASLLVGLSIRMLMTWLLQKINHATGDVPLIINVLYLLLQRPTYCIGTTLSMLPFILRNKSFKPMTNFMTSPFWYPLARLTYGAYLSHSIFMLFRGYNTEKGVWASESEAFLFFFAYLTFSFVFSLIMTLLVEIPCRRVYFEFIVKLRGSLHDRVSASFRSLKSSESKASLGSAGDQKDLYFVDSSEVETLDNNLNDEGRNYLPRVEQDSTVFEE